MELYLAKDEPLKLHNSKRPRSMFSTFTSWLDSILPLFDDDEDESIIYEQSVIFETSLVSDDGINMKKIFCEKFLDKEKSLINWNLVLTLRIADDEKAGKVTASISLDGDNPPWTGEASILSKLQDLFADEVRVNLKLHTLWIFTHYDAIYFIDIDCKDLVIRAPGVLRTPEIEAQVLRRPPTSAYWENGKYHTQKVLTLSIIIPNWPSADCLQTNSRVLGASSDHTLSLVKKILHEDVATDLVIIAGNGTEVKCHKCFLFVQSSELRKIVESDSEGGKDGKLDMSDMSEEGVRAFLAYLYYGDLTAPSKNCDLALQLHRAGRKYNIFGLEESARDLLLDLEEGEFTVQVALQLFQYGRNIESDQANRLKKKVAKVLKAKFAELEGTPEYRKLFIETIETPESAMELFKYFGTY